MARSVTELMGLQYEAERLVRSGVSRADVARMLDVHPQTLAGWALRGGWRRKDLDIERSGAAARRVVRNVVAAHAWADARALADVDARRTMFAGIDLAAAGEREQVALLLAASRAGERALPVAPELEGAALDALVAGSRSLAEADAAVRALEGLPPEGVDDDPGAVSN